VIGRRTAWALVGVCALSVVAHGTLLVLTGTPLLSAAALHTTFPIIPLALLTGAVVGALIVTRYPRHRIGWLFCIGQTGAALGVAGQMLGDSVLNHRLPALAGTAPDVGRTVYWAAELVGGPWGLALLALLLLLAPDGRALSRRWWPVAWFVLGSLAVQILGVLWQGPAGTGPGREPPLGAGVLQTGGQLGIAVGILAGAVALALRMRRSRGEERQQLRWIAAAAVLFAATMLVFLGAELVVLVRTGGARPTEPTWAEMVFYLGYLAVPLATGVAVLRHRLYDLDLVISAAVVVALLASLVTAGYVLLVTAATTVLPGRAPSVLAFVVVALALQPVRRQLRRLADRIAYGRLAGPYQALAEFTRQIGGMPSDADLLPQVAAATAQAVDARAAAATLTFPGGTDLTVSWPPGAELDGGLRLPIRYDGEALGEIVLVPRRGRAPDRAQRALLDSFAAHAGLAFRNARLAAALRAEADTLRREAAALAASRRRLAGAAFRERDRLVVAIRRDVVAPLASIPPQLADVQTLLAERPARTGPAAESLSALSEQVSSVLETLRTLTRGVFPALLERRGLPAALASEVDRFGPDVRLTVAPGLADRRLPAPLETAVYFCAVEGLRALSGPRAVDLDLPDDRLILTVRGAAATAADRDRLRPAMDRVEAVGGSARVETGPDGAVVVLAVVPISR
jgi:signal transduction histidine kinase